MKQITNYSPGIAGTLLLVIICTIHLNAQISTEACQTVLHGLTYEQMRQDAALISRKRNTVRGRGETASTDTVPVFFSVFRNDDGSFAGPKVDEDLIRQALNQLNDYFAPIHLYFVQLGAINYIDNTALTGFTRHHHLAALSYVSTALNIYTSSGSGSFAQFPPAVDAGNGSAAHLQSGADRSNLLSLNSSHFLSTSFAHEMGHSYGLLHTFEGARVYHNPLAPTPGYTGAFQDHPYGAEGNTSRRELVLRQPDESKAFSWPNAATAGDLVEDTPAFCVSTAAFPSFYPDMNQESCGQYPFDRNKCNGCIIVDCNYEGNYVDYNGDPLINTDVSIKNLMSYTNCRSEFTAGQYERMAFYHERVRALQYDAGLKINLNADVTFEDSGIPMDDVMLHLQHPGQFQHSNVVTNTQGAFQAILYAPRAGVRLMKPGSALNPTYQPSPWVQAELEEIVALSYQRSDWMQGVDAQDLLLLQRHLSGLDTLDAYHRIAADLDHDGRLTKADADLLQAFLAGEIEQFTDYASPWQFFPAYIAQEYNDAFQRDPFNMKLEGIQYREFAPYLEAEWEFNIGEHSIGSQGFRAVKMGDLDGSSLRPTSPETCLSESLSLYLPTHSSIQAGSRINMTISTGNELTLNGFEFIFTFNSNKLTLQEISTDGLPDFRVEEHIFIPEGGSSIRVVWTAPKGEELELSVESPLLHFTFTSLAPIGLLARQLDISPESHLVFSGVEDCNSSVRLEASANITPPSQSPPGISGSSPYSVEKFTCYPNPTNGEFTAVFKSRVDSKGELIISDGLLRPLYKREVVLDQGLNEIRIDTQRLPAGLLVVMIRNEDGTFYQRVVKAR
ncbi:MAG: hypothetical protein KDD15_04515 [Lewinella sp.]|nr:hypothetical protein [Lewinella sp.]